MNEARYRQGEQALWTSTGAHPSERTIALDRTGNTIHIEEVGAGPPVAFVHGASNGGTSWASLVARLEGFRCIVMDRPGCGLSPRLPIRHGDMAALAAFADDLVVDVLDAVGVAQAHVVGTSFGGYFALRAAAAHPDRVDRLVTLSWGFGARPRQRRRS